MGDVSAPGFDSSSVCTNTYSALKKVTALRIFCLRDLNFQTLKVNESPAYRGEEFTLIKSGTYVC